MPRHLLCYLLILVCSTLITAQEDPLEIYDTTTENINAISSTLNTATGDVFVTASLYNKTTYKEKILYFILSKTGEQSFTPSNLQYNEPANRLTASGPDAAYNTKKKQYLQVWVEYGPNNFLDIHGQLVKQNGKSKRAVWSLPSAYLNRRTCVVTTYDVEDKNETFILVYERQASLGTDNGIYYVLLNKKGKANGDPVQLTQMDNSSGPITRQAVKDIIKGEDGYYYVTFVQQTKKNGVLSEQVGMFAFKPGEEVLGPVIYDNGSGITYFEPEIAQISTTVFGVAYMAAGSNYTHVYMNRYKSVIKKDRLKKKGAPIKFDNWDNAKATAFATDENGDLYHLTGESNSFNLRTFKKNGKTGMEELIFPYVDNKGPRKMVMQPVLGAEKLIAIVHTFVYLGSESITAFVIDKNPAE